MRTPLLVVAQSISPDSQQCAPPIIAGAIATVKGSITTAAKTPTLAFFRKLADPLSFTSASKAGAFFPNGIEKAAKQISYAFESSYPKAGL